MAADLTKGVPNIIENFVLGNGSHATALTQLPVKGFSVVSATVNPASTATLAASTTDVTATGVAAGDIIVPMPPTGFDVGHVITCVAQTDKIVVRIFNGTAGTVDIASATWNFLIIDVT